MRGAPARTTPASRGHDLRLAPAAVACWATAWLATGAPAAGVRTGAVAVLAATSVAAAVLAGQRVLGGLGHGRSGRQDPTMATGPRAGRREAARRGTCAVAASVVLAGACAAGVLTVAAAELGRREAPAVAGLAARGGAAVVELVVTGDPASGQGAEAWQQEQVRVPVELVLLDPATGPDVRVNVPALLRADSSWDDARWGERRRAVVRLREAPPGEPYAVIASVPGRATVLAEPRWWWRAAERLRSGLTGAATAGGGGGAAGVSDGAALLPGLVVGDTRLQQDDLVDDLRVAGLSHLSSVSGANVTIVCGGVLLLVVLLRGGRRTGAVLAAAALVALVVVARPEPSVLRAAVMGSVGLVGVLVGRRGGGTSALCLAVVTVLLLDPWLSRAAGFRLSVAATGALVLCAVPWSRALGRVAPRPVALALAVPAAAQVAVTPLLVGLEPTVSLYALPANVLVAPAVAPATVLGLVAALLSLVHGGAAAVVAAPARWCAAWIAAVGRTASDLPSASVPVPEGAVGAAAAGAGTLAVLAVVALALRAVPDRRAHGQAWAGWPRPRLPAPRARRTGPAAGAAQVPRSVAAGAVDPRSMVLGLAALTLVLLLVLHAGGRLPGRADPWPGEGWQAVVCDVGQGEAVLVRAGPSSAVVVDAGPEPALVERCLRRAGVTTVPLLVLTHLHADHVGGLDGVTTAAPVQAVWTSPGGMPTRVEAALERWASDAGATLDRPVGGSSAVVGSVRVDVLTTGTPGTPEGDAQDVNDAGLVLRLDTGSLVLLAVGDVGADVQQRLLREHGPAGVRADVTTVAHHGASDQLPAFYAAVGARVAVASAGRDNTYGHPTDRARDVLAAAGATVLSTAADGSVALRGVSEPGPGTAGEPGAATVGVRTTRRRVSPTEPVPPVDTSGGSRGPTRRRLRPTGPGSASGRVRRPCQHDVVAERHSSRGRPSAPVGPGPFDVEPAPVVLLLGTEAALADIAMRRLIARVREVQPDVERHELGPQRHVVGDVSAAVAPSLFGGGRLVVLDGLEAAAGSYSDEVVAVAKELAAEPDGELVIVGRHAGGNGGKAVLAALEAVPGAVRVACAPVTGERERADLVVARLRASGRRAEPAAVQALVEALGGDLAELLAVSGQLAETVTGGAVGVGDVRALVGGRREARGFDIADAAIAGQAGEALSLLRHALSQRVEPVLVVGALGMKLRGMAKVAGAGRGPSAALAKELSMAPWQIDRARRDLQGWDPRGLGAAVVAVADADAAVKGEIPGVAAAYALERAVVAVTDARTGN